MEFVHFRLLDRKTDESSFFQNSDGTKDEDKKLDYTNSYGILNPYFVNVAGKRVVYQYILGCDIFDPAEQKKQGYIVNMANCLVEFTKGADIILDKDLNAPLIIWLKGHPKNRSSVNYKEIHGEPDFYEFDPKEVLKKEVEDVTAEDEAMDILRELRKKPEKMKAVALVFEGTQLMDDEMQIYLTLRDIAKSDPAGFKKSIASRENDVLADIITALKYNIIIEDAKGYIYKSDSAVILATETKNNKVSKEVLTTYLMSKAGETHLRQIGVLIRKHEIDLESAKS